MIIYNNPKRKSLKEHTNEELIHILNNNTNTDLLTLSCFLSEIMRRMNERSPLLPEENNNKNLKDIK